MKHILLSLCLLPQTKIILVIMGVEAILSQGVILLDNSVLTKGNVEEKEKKGFPGNLRNLIWPISHFCVWKEN